MALHLLDNTLQIEIYYSSEDGDLEDNVCLCIRETCPDEERLFRAKETNIFLTVAEANALADALRSAAENSLQQGSD